MQRVVPMLAVFLLGVALTWASFSASSAAQGAAPGVNGEGAEIDIPAGQAFFTTTHFTTGVVFPNFALIPGVVGASNGTATRTVVVRFSADAYNSSSASRSVVRLRVDGGPCIVAGPELFNNSHTGSGVPLEVRTWQGVVRAGPGFHTYQMCGAVFPAGAGTASWGFRTLTVEARASTPVQVRFALFPRRKLAAWAASSGVLFRDPPNSPGSPREPSTEPTPVDAAVGPGHP